MAHKCSVDVLDNDGNILTSCRRCACDSMVRPKDYKQGQIWKRYIEIDNCIYSPSEIKAWCRFVTGIGCKCSFSKKVVDVSIEKKIWDCKTNKYLPSEFEIVKCYTISLDRKDYESNVHLFVGNTLVRLISYYYDKNYENIYNIIKTIKLPITRMEKLLLAHYYFEYLEMTHGLVDVRAGSSAFTLLKKLEIKDGVNKTFTKKLTEITCKDVYVLMKDNKFKEAYKLLKDKEK